MRTAPMRRKLTAAAATVVAAADEIEGAIRQKGTLMVIVNSVCGFAAGKMPPGVRAAIRHGVRPDRIVTVFAGQDPDATQIARQHFMGSPPPSPSTGIFLTPPLSSLPHLTAI